jgi:hypothetical protein
MRLFKDDAQGVAMLLAFDLDDVTHRRAVRQAARALHLPIEGRDGPARFQVRVECADDAYRLGLETMKRWRAALGRDYRLRERL